MDQSLHKRPKCQQLRNSGKAYVSIRGWRPVVEKRLIHMMEHKCRLDCMSKFAEDDRQHIFDAFWSLADFNDQNVFLAGCIQQSGIQRRRSANLSMESRTRMFSRRYFLTHSSDSSTPFEVCKSFFLGTLAVSNGRIDRLLQKQGRSDGIVPKDQRGRTCGSCSNAYDEASLVFARRYLDDHRKSGHSQRPVLDGVTIYAAYVTECEKSCRKPIKPWKLRELHKRQLNVG